MATRLSLDETMMAVALVLAQRATCVKRKVGCVLTDMHGRILSTGYNGVARGLPHCTEHVCPGAYSITGSDSCQAVHAEVNALLTCRDTERIDTCYTTVLPCNSCMKTLMNTSCARIVYLEEHEAAAFVLNNWRKAGGTALKLVRPKWTD